ncbi:MAG: MAPEG family protein [Thioalkalispiraceae bacterium]
MNSSLIVYPMFAMVILTVIVGLRMLQLRYRAVFQDNLNPVYFKLNRGGKPPEYMTQAEQHYINLFESPVLFYVIGVLLYMTQFVDVISLSLAWAYVLVRLAHAYVHMGHNRILMRRNVFLLSIALIVALWGYLFIRLSLI